MKPLSEALRGSLFDILYPKSSRQPGRDELGSCWVKGSSAEVQIRRYKKAKCFGMEVSAFIDAAPAIMKGRQV